MSVLYQEINFLCFISKTNEHTVLRFIIKIFHKKFTSFENAKIFTFRYVIYDATFSNLLSSCSADIVPYDEWMLLQSILI